MRIAFLGLGNMGLPMARNLAAAGHDLTVYNRHQARADELAAGVARGGPPVRQAATPGEAVRDAEIAITMLADDAAVEQVVFENRGILASLPRDAAHVSMSTISVGLADRLSGAHHQAGQAFVSAPVFGRPEAAADAKLWVVAAGPEAQVSRCRPAFDAVAQGLFVVGDTPSTANLVKLAGNFTLAGMIETLGEAFALVRRAGVTAQQFLEVVNTSLFKSPVYQNYGTIIANERFEPAGFRLKLGLKDARLALEAAGALAVPLPLASLVRDHFLAAIAHGDAEKDWSTVATVSARAAGL